MKTWPRFCYTTLLCFMQYITFTWEGKWFNQWPYYNTTVKLWLLCKNYVTFRKRSIVAVSLIIVAIIMQENLRLAGGSGTHQLMFLATGFCLFLRQFSNLLLYVPDLSLHPLVLILLPVFIANTLVSFLSHLLQVFLQPRYKRLEDEHGQMEKPKIRAHKKDRNTLKQFTVNELWPLMELFIYMHHGCWFSTQFTTRIVYEIK